jgi:hypothetical protein
VNDNFVINVQRTGYSFPFLNPPKKMRKEYKKKEVSKPAIIIFITEKLIVGSSWINAGRLFS